MGGVIIISLLAAVLLLCDLTNLYVQLLIISTLWLSFIGFLDDTLKLRSKSGKKETRAIRFLGKLQRKDKDGMKGKLKIYGQVGLGLIVGLALYISDQAVIVEIAHVPGHVEQTEQAEELQYIRHIKSAKTTILS